ncbi:hypothetical protein HJFPF1_01390 [Paramyrothecium foliicola]|nr:hypothetical protein HJFPF1_01390 [Paramyrothecium foliicola]
MAREEQTPPQPGLSANNDSNGSRGKGKEKEPTVAERLQASGRLAFNSAISTQPLPNQMTSEKAVGSSRGSTSWEPSASNETALHHNQQSGISESFRCKTSHSEHTSRAFEEFQEPAGSHWTHEQLQLSQSLPQSLAQQEAFDGFAVVDMLSQRDQEGTFEDLSGGYELSPETFANLRRALFESDFGASIWNGLLDFSPDFITSADDSSSKDRRQYLGVAEPNHARQIWAQQWAEVFSNYNAEVWGDLGPLVSKAKREVEDLTTSQGGSLGESSDTSAVDRLRQILAHVRGHA